LALFQTSAAFSSIVAPADLYSSLEKPDNAPALFSTSTVCPAAVSCFTPSGLTEIRLSLFYFFYFRFYINYYIIKI